MARYVSVIASLLVVLCAHVTTVTAFAPRPGASSSCRVVGNDVARRGMRIVNPQLGVVKDARRVSGSIKDSRLLPFKPLWNQQKKQQQSAGATLKKKAPSVAPGKGRVASKSLAKPGAPNSSVGSGTTTDVNPKTIILPALALLLAAGAAVAAKQGWTLADVASTVESVLHDPQAALNSIVDIFQAMGALSGLYFGLFYIAAELLAVPATPLTLSAGYLFGLANGVGIVLVAATTAACIAYYIGRTFLRTWVEGILSENPKFAKLDRAIGEQGFKLLVLVRLTPIFPFSISNYVYGASSINFPAYFWGTLLGFTPGTIAYVYTGMVGKELLLGDSGQPWYIYTAGLGALLIFLKLVTDVATGIVEAIDDDVAN